jgi:peptidoglycan-N-acetylglucosamine deacetylase
MSEKAIASLSLDLDNKWSYMKTHGDAGWESFPSYLSLVVPRVLRYLKSRGLKITFFVVGQDAALEKNRAALAAIAADGHEIGNHSFRHEPWLHVYSEAEVEREIAEAEAHIERATGRLTVGFRGPGFSCSGAVLRVLERRGYEYDASTFPTYLGPLARAYYFMTARLTPEERERRKGLFGAAREGLRPLKPYRWRTPGGELIELPVTTLPVFKLPFHVSYVVYLSQFSPALAKLYFRSALNLCAACGVEPSLLLHPLDFLGGDDVRELSFFPGMRLRAEQKLEFVSELVDLYAAKFAVLTMRQHAACAAERGGLKVFESGSLADKGMLAAGQN